VLDAQFYGVAQRRRRVFIVGNLGDDWRTPAQILAIAESSARYLEQSNTKRKETAGSVSDGIRDDSRAGNFELYDFPKESISPTLNARRAKDTMTYSEVARMQGFGDYQMDEISGALKARDYKDATDLVIQPFVKIVRSGARAEDGSLPAEVWAERDTAPTLNVMDNNGESRATVLNVDPTFFYAKSHQDVRIQGEVINTLAAAMGTGGGNTPMVFEPKSAFEENWAESEVKNSLRANASKSSHAIIHAIQNTVIGRKDTSGPQGKGYGNEGDPMFTLDTTSPHAVAFDTYNQTTNENTTQTIRSGAAGVDHIGAILSKATVRRLTPTECERLQGFPDGWTEGQVDSHRYKQLGNAVAVPVVQWIIDRMVGK
jgi:DNA (cytosine-5)-methyltransferase 1